MTGESASSPDRVRAAEIIGVLSLATDLGMGLPMEHGLQSTLVAMRLCERLGVNAETTAHTFYCCLLFYVGCTVDADVVAETFPDGALLAHFQPGDVRLAFRDDGGHTNRISIDDSGVDRRRTTRRQCRSRNYQYAAKVESTRERAGKLSRQ